MEYLLLFHINNGYAKAPPCYVTRTLPVLFMFSIGWTCKIYQDGRHVTFMHVATLIYLETFFSINHTSYWIRYFRNNYIKYLSLFRNDIIYSMSIIVQQDATMYSLLYFYKLLYMFRVVTPPIIRSTYNCNYSIWHWSNFGKWSMWSQLKMRFMDPSLLPSAI